MTLRSAGLLIYNAIGTQSFNGATMASLYGFPRIANPGEGQKIGIVQLGGVHSQADLQYYFTQQGLGTAPIVNVVILKGSSMVDDNASVEVALDVQIIAAVCPMATITVYFAPNSLAGFYNAIEIAAQNNDCVSVSWGCDEAIVPTEYINTFQALISSCKKPVFVASGDNGSAGNVGIGLNVGFPASVPSAIACGGTSIVVSNGAIASESAWSGSGGGYSKRYPIPAYQSKVVGGQLRGVPDVSGNADPKSGYNVYVSSKGGMLVIGGTSAVAPLWSALIALINQCSGSSKLQNINASLYGLIGGFRDVVGGSNGAYGAIKSWDAVTGLGVPIGQGLLEGLFRPTEPTAPPKPPEPPAPPAPTPRVASIMPRVIMMGSVVNINVNGENLNGVQSVELRGSGGAVHQFVIVKKSNTSIVCRLGKNLIQAGNYPLVLKSADSSITSIQTIKIENLPIKSRRFPPRR